jgi:hypothetical protein
MIQLSIVKQVVGCMYMYKMKIKRNCPVFNKIKCFDNIRADVTFMARKCL